ncbi:MAG: PEP-CTERM sorting domain-containing protein [Bryobacteraceae bacterium]
MKSIARLSLMGSGLGLIFLTAVPSFAAVVFNPNTLEDPATSQILNLGGDGNVVVTPTNITFSNSDTHTGTSTEVGAGTTLTFSGGTVTPGDPVEVNGGAPISPTGPPDMSGAYPVDVPVTFPSSPALSLVLTSFGPGTGNTCASSPNYCSPLGGTSPIILSASGDNTTASLPVNGTEYDNGRPIGSVSGSFSANIAGMTPTELASVASFSTTSSAQLTITGTSAVPEPRTVSLVVLAGMLLGIAVTKRRRSEAGKNEA